MGEADLVRQLELYASLLRQAPYSPRVWVTRRGRRFDAQVRRIDAGDPAPAAPARRHHPDDRGRARCSPSYFRNNALHLLLHAVADRLRVPQQRDGARAPTCCASRAASIPYVAEEYFLRWTRRRARRRWSTNCSRTCCNHGLLSATEDRSVWQRPPAESSEAVQLSVLARVTVPILERYYLAHLAAAARPAAAA